MKTNEKAVASLIAAAVLVTLGVTASFWSFRQIELTADARAHKVSDFVKGQPKVLTRIKATPSDLLTVSALTAMEVGYGALS